MAHGNTETTIRVSTDVLREILQGDALVELERSAIEKVAEELQKKVNNTLTAKIQNRVEEISNQHLNKLKTKYTFPAEAAAMIAAIAKDAVASAVSDMLFAAEGELRRQVDVLVADGVKTMQLAVDESYESHEKSLDNRIKELARAEFFDVLAAARGTNT